MITTKDIEKLAELSRIKITDAEKESFSKEIDSILGYVADIQKASGEATVSLEKLNIIKNVMREDVATTSTGQYTEAILTEAPQREGQYIAVKKILS